MHFPSLFIVAATAVFLAGPSMAETQCSPKVVALATGIHLNIIGQMGELAAVQSLQAIESKTSAKNYTVSFEIGKGELLGDITGGMKIREFNQAIAPKGNDATAGLKTYAAAQATELKLAQSLTGKPSHDKSVLATLVKDVEQGTALNRRNLKAATNGCSLGFTFPS